MAKVSVKRQFSKTQNANYIRKILQSEKDKNGNPLYKDFQISAILGNLEVESGFDFTITDGDVDKSSYGLAQWRGGRRNGVYTKDKNGGLTLNKVGVVQYGEYYDKEKLKSDRKMLGLDENDNSFDGLITQTRFISEEIRAGAGNHEAILNTKNLYEATNAFNDGYEVSFRKKDSSNKVARDHWKKMHENAVKWETKRLYDGLPIDIKALADNNALTMDLEGNYIDAKTGFKIKDEFKGVLNNYFSAVKYSEDLKNNTFTQETQNDVLESDLTFPITSEGWGDPSAINMAYMQMMLKSQQDTNKTLTEQIKQNQDLIASQKKKEEEHKQATIQSAEQKVLQAKINERNFMAELMLNSGILEPMEFSYKNRNRYAVDNQNTNSNTISKYVQALNMQDEVVTASQMLDAVKQKYAYTSPEILLENNTDIENTKES